MKNIITEAFNMFRVGKTVSTSVVNKVTKSDVIKRNNSVVDHYFQELDRRDGTNLNSFLYGEEDYQENLSKQQTLSSILTNKPQKLAEFRAIAESAIIIDILDEIATQALNFDEEGKCINLKITDANAEHDYTTIKEEFHNFIELFDLENKLPQYVTELLVEGEICFENIFNPADLSDGIIAIKKIKNEAYEFAIDINTSTREGITILNNTADIPKDVIAHLASQFGFNKGLDNLSTYANAKTEINKNVLFMPWNQLTYCNTGKYTQDGLNIIPPLNRVRKPFNQLTLIEDAILIYRLVRAPERLAFNIDGGNMSNAKAEQMKLRLMKKYGNKQSYDTQTGTVNSQYNAMSMMDNYWFVATNGGRGTKVESVGGTGNSLASMEDLDYFKNKVYRSMCVPYTRAMEPTTSIDRADTINYEEYKLAKFIMSILSRLSQSIKASFINHLQFKGLVTDDINTRDIVIQFVPPTAFDVYSSQKLLQAKVDIYNAAKDIYGDDFSYILGMKYLNLTKEECDDVFDLIEEAAIRKAKIEFKTSNVSDHGDPEPESDDDY
jgi:hypothetical protein